MFPSPLRPDGSNCVQITGYRVCAAVPACCVCSEILAVLQALLLVCTCVMGAFVVLATCVASVHVCVGASYV